MKNIKKPTPVARKQYANTRLYREGLCRRWIVAACRPDLESRDIETIHKNYRICDIHFNPTQRLKKKLKANAVPTCNLPDPSEDVNNRTKSTQTDVEFDPCSSVPSTSAEELHNVTNQSMQRETTSGKRKLSNSSVNSCKIQKPTKPENYIPYQERESKFTAAHERIEFITKWLKQVYPGELFESEYNKFVMKLYLSSPLAYKCLYKSLNLPSEKMLRKKKIIDVGTYLSDSMIQCLKYKCEKLSKSEKVCVLNVSSMELKPELRRQVHTNQTIGFHDIEGLQTKNRATHVFVLIARGLFSKWTQPIAYCFSKNTINYHEITTWVQKTAMKILEIGFDVASITTDNESIFFVLSLKNPKYLLKNSKIAIMFDVPELINSLREVLMMNDIIYRDGGPDQLTASWDDIRSLYNLEQNKNCRLAHKLTNVHIGSLTLDRSKVKYAAQVFSRSVAAAIQCNIGSGKLPDKANGTATFVQRVNNLFDILNSSPHRTIDTYKYKKEYSGESYQNNTLVEFLRLVGRLRVIDKSNKDITVAVMCLNNFRKTINALLLLSMNLKTKGYNYFYTKRLNTDVINIFFKTVRQKLSVYREPTPLEFHEEFENNFINSATYTRSITSANECNKLCSQINFEFLIRNGFIEIQLNENAESEEDESAFLDIKSNKSEESEEEDEYMIENQSNQCEELDYSHFNEDRELDVQAIINNEIENILTQNQSQLEEVEDCLVYSVVEIDD
ncbi:jg6025 [Pararge aegeria aegeria]|uniref:Jg6025 protein n=1 Tax=Pararge aegeria aegeria TaxID=348720 RepID=A0A8S4QF07_9NEOP|nr:jg6025 [Pararge aegeria aegeria]